MTVYANQFQLTPIFQRTLSSEYKYKYFFCSDKVFIIKTLIEMGNKVIRLTEADIKKMVDKVLSEQRYEERGKSKKPGKKRFNLSNQFESGQYKLVANSQLNDIIKQIKSFISGYDMNNVVLNISAGESQVPNPKGFEEKGSLASARAKELKNYLEKNLDTKVSNIETKIGDTPWDKSKGKDHPDYKEEQFVNLDVDLKGLAPKPKIMIVDKPMYGQNASGDKTFVGFVDGSMFVFNKNNETQRELLSQFSGIPEFGDFRKNRLRLSQVCNKHDSLCDVVKYDKNDYVVVDNEDVFNQLIDKVKKERLIFPNV
jgi:hypothetical protein